jgi:nucleoside-diphosphate-sugar epimerase
MRIMITGAKGFIGSYLSSYFREVGHQVFDCGRDKLDLLDANATKAFMNGSTYFDLVIHCALVGRENINDLKQSMNDTIVSDNLRMWDNLVNNRHRFKRLINIGTGHEFDIDNDVNYAEEIDIFKAEPKYSYGFVKNQIAKDLVQYENFYNLRLFGVFHYSESPKRFFRKIFTSSNREFHIPQDRYFDFINLEDIPPMIEIIMNGEAKHRDINMVYQDKKLLSELANMFNLITMSQAKIIVDNTNGLSYTGDHRRFSSYNTLKMGLPLGFLRY